MFQKALHTGNIAASIAVATSAADLTFAGGAATTIGVTLSSLEVFKKGDKATKAMATQIAKELEAAFGSSHLPKDQCKLVAQMLSQFEISESHLARGNLIAVQIAANMRDHIADTAIDPAHKTDAALTAYETILAQTLTPVMVAPAGVDQLQFEIFKEMLLRSDQSGRTDNLREEGITEKAIIRLAQRTAANTHDVGQAWLELQRTIDVAVRVQAEGRVQSNQGGFVDAVLEHVAELARDGEYASAGAEIDEALARDEEKTKARRGRLIDGGVKVALLNRDTAKAAELLVDKADLDAGGVAQFEELRKLRTFYYELGRDDGINLDLELAIDLAELVISRAVGYAERGTALDELGTSLSMLGQREYGTARLEEAVTAYEAALEERTRVKSPFDWATTQNNLGVALFRLGEREGDPSRMQAAVIALNEALKVKTQQSAPRDWASAQNNIGSALLRLGERGNEAAPMKDAITAFKEALKEFTRERAPLQWAETQDNLGSAMCSLGALEGDLVLLEGAMTAYRETLKERVREKVPLDWALTQNNISTLYCSFYDLDGDVVHVDRATGHVAAALEVFLKTEQKNYKGMASQVVGAIQSRRDG